jgi:hypothetical protein
MTKIRASLSGDKKLQKAFKDLNAVARGSAVTESLVAGAAIIQADTVRRAPVKTGNLRNSYQTTVVNDQLVTVGTVVEYALPVEARKPHLRPAVDENEAAIVGAITSVLRRKIESVG